MQRSNNTNDDKKMRTADETPRTYAAADNRVPRRWWSELPFFDDSTAWKGSQSGKKTDERKSPETTLNPVGIMRSIVQAQEVPLKKRLAWIARNGIRTMEIVGLMYGVPRRDKKVSFAEEADIFENDSEYKNGSEDEKGSEREVVSDVRIAKFIAKYTGTDHFGMRIPISSLFSSEKTWLNYPREFSTDPLEKRTWRHGELHAFAVQQRAVQHLKERIKILRSGVENRYTKEEIEKLDKFQQVRMLYRLLDRYLPGKATTRTMVEQIAMGRRTTTEDMAIREAYRVLPAIYEDVLGHDILFLAACELRPDFNRIEYLMLFGEEPF